jgi:hypothetical protein
MTTITPEQRMALVEAGDSPLILSDPQSGDAFVLVREEVYRKMRDLLEGEADNREHEAWEKVARKAREQWAMENPY